MNWNDAAYNEISAKHPALEKKPESVALAVHALTQNRDMTPQDWRELSAKTGVRVAGRAVGSAREILGIREAKSRPSKAGARRPGRPKGSKNKSNKSFARSQPGTAVDSLVSTIQELQRERDAAVQTLDKVRTLLNSLS